jgi:hypothetical protein
MAQVCSISTMAAELLVMSWACHLLNIFQGEQAQNITNQGRILRGFLFAEITHFHYCDAAAFILLYKEQVVQPDDALLAHGAQRGQNLAGK